MPNSFERHFVVNPEGEAEEVKDGTKEAVKQPSTKKILGMAQDRKFVVGEEGEAVVEGDNKEKLAVKRKDGSVEKFVQ
jgi:hypothetical protein